MVSLLRSLYFIVALLFFASHIPVTVFIDSQALFPSSWYPPWARTMLDDFLRDYKDPLVRVVCLVCVSFFEGPVNSNRALMTLPSSLPPFPFPLQMSPPMEIWFQSFVWTEVLFQLPFFFVATYALVMRRNWIRIPAIIYGSFVCATMVPILTVLATTKAPGYNPLPLIAFYSPYLLVPACLVAYMAVNEQPFGPSKSAQYTQHFYKYD